LTEHDSFIGMVLPNLFLSCIRNILNL
jgi:hypothetical protein